MDIKLIEEIFQALTDFPNQLGVISTVNGDEKPNSATVYYTFDKDLNIYFITRMGSRKYKNYLKNPNVAFVATGELPPRTVQLEGVLSSVEDHDETKKYFTDLLEHASKAYPLPPYHQMMGSGIALMKITPTWVRLGDFDVLRKTETFNETVFLVK